MDCVNRIVKNLARGGQDIWDDMGTLDISSGCAIVDLIFLLVQHGLESHCAANTFLSCLHCVLLLFCCLRWDPLRACLCDFASLARSSKHQAKKGAVVWAVFTTHCGSPPHHLPLSFLDSVGFHHRQPLSENSILRFVAFSVSHWYFNSCSSQRGNCIHAMARDPWQRNIEKW